MDVQQLIELKETAVAISYLLASVFFIFGIKRLSHPKTAPGGNFLGALGMLLATLTALVDFGMVIDFTTGAISWPGLLQNWYWILGALVVGSAIGMWSALGVKMTGMPQMVALFNGFGGAASFLVAGVYFATAGEVDLSMQTVIATIASGIIGAITLTGSLVAYAKLQGLPIVPDKPLTFFGDQFVKLALLLGSIVLGVFLALYPQQLDWYWWMVLAGSVLGYFLVVGIGGADMPVVISLLNSYSGIAAAATGFVLGNVVLIISGSLVGASGIILTAIMCKAMNRSLTNVLFGGFGATADGPSADEVYGGKIKSTSADELAMVLQTAQKVCIVPGYGMAVARASTPVRILTEALEADGIEVSFGIHPVAGRMPGHMNVLLAEENIEYEKLKEMDQINPEIGNYDVAIVLGANDVVNPQAREPNTPISGMPIIDVDKATTVVVVKRSLSPGYAGIPNPLFANDNTLMLFGDGKKVMEEVVAAYKEA